MLELINQYVEDSLEQGKSENTIRNYKNDILLYVGNISGGTPGDAISQNRNQALKIYAQLFESRSPSKDNETDIDTIIESGSESGIDDLERIIFATRNDINNYLESERKSGLSVSTVNRRLQAIKAFYAFLQSKGYIDHNPADGVKQTKVARQNETRWLYEHQVREIFRAIDEHIKGERKQAQYRAIFSVLVNCGLRAQELADLKLEHIDWDYGLLSVIGKGNKFRKVPFNPATQRNVKRWMEYRRSDGEYLFQTERSNHMTVRAIEHMAKELIKHLSFTFTVHQLRHTALKRIADKTGQIEIVASIAGHENVNTSRRYIEPSLAEIGEAMKGTEFDF